MLFKIYEGNIDALDKKMAHIQKKCEQYGCQFKYEKIGSHFETIVNGVGERWVARFITVEVEGVAVINDWRFVAALEHRESGNLITGVCGIEVPERYYHCDAVCEHCGTNRERKRTFIVQNTKTGQFMQVGKSCLRDFTGGLSAELAATCAETIKMFDTLGKVPDDYVGSTTIYFKTDLALAYAAEVVRNFGYVKSGDDRCTRDRVDDYYLYNEEISRLPSHREAFIRDELALIDLDVHSPEVKAYVVSALNWIREKEEDSNYIHNLKIICSEEYTPLKDLGILVSLVSAYNNALERAKRADSESVSQWVGDIGKRINIKVKSFKAVTSWESNYGVTFVWKITDICDNVFTWKTGKYLTELNRLRGTVKNHSEFCGVKQTELTRCTCS